MRDLVTSAPLLIFLASAAAVWWAGAPLARATDAIGARLGLGEALAGALILAIVTNLPECAIAASAAMRGDLSLAIGNLLGGIAAQMLVLVALDIALKSTGSPLVTQASTPAVQIETLLVVALLGIVLAASQLNGAAMIGPLGPGEIATPIVWIGAMFLIARVRPTGSAVKSSTPHALSSSTIVTFVAGALVTLVGGVGLEIAGDALATQWGMNGVLFGATVLAAATSLPELSTGLAAARGGEREMAVSDIVGGNAFLPVILTPAALIAGTSAYAGVSGVSSYFSALGVVLCAIYAVALALKPMRRFAGIGPDSVAMLVVYAVAIVLIAAAQP